MICSKQQTIATQLGHLTNPINVYLRGHFFKWVTDKDSPRGGRAEALWQEQQLQKVGSLKKNSS